MAQQSILNQWDQRVLWQGEAETLKDAVIAAVPRFMAKVQKTGYCWLWIGATRGTGYGCMKLFSRVVSAHKFAYRAFVGPIPANQMVLHRCDVRLCCNPDHLFLGTGSDNMRDAVRKGRHVSNPTCGTRHHSARLSPAIANAIRESTDSHRLLARRHGVSERAIRKVRARETWWPLPTRAQLEAEQQAAQTNAEGQS